MYILHTQVVKEFWQEAASREGEDFHAAKTQCDTGQSGTMQSVVLRWLFFAAYIAMLVGGPDNPLTHGGSGPPSNTWSLGTIRIIHPHGISISSTIFAGLTNVMNRPTILLRLQQQQTTSSYCYDSLPSTLYANFQSNIDSHKKIPATTSSTICQHGRVL